MLGLRTKRTFIQIALSQASLMLVLALPAQATMFKFNPPDGTRFVQDAKSTRTESNDVTGKKTNLSYDIQQIVEYKRDASGNILETHKPTHVSYMMDNVPVKADNENFYYGRLLQNSNLTIIHDSKGQVTNLTGLKESIERFARDIGSDSPVVNSFITNIKSTIAYLGLNLASHSSLFIGRNADLGSSWTATKSVLYQGGGAMSVDTRYKVTGRVKVKGKNCVRVAYSYSADPATTRDFAELNALPEVQNALKDRGQSATISSANLSARGEYIVDPETLLIYKQTSTSTIIINFNIPAVGILKSTEKDWIDITFDYGK